jgi:hypothetical protein
VGVGGEGVGDEGVGGLGVGGAGVGGGGTGVGPLLQEKQKSAPLHCMSSVQARDLSLQALA